MPNPLRFLSLATLVFTFSPKPAHAQEANTLTEAERAKGWQLMFDGKTMAGWHSFQKTSVTDNGWLIKDSSIYLRGPLPNGPATGALLAPERFAFKNFEISIDWKIPDAGNSGIFLRYLETEASENIRTGPESQVCGKLHADYQGGVKSTSPGACYGMFPPAQPWIKSEDEYNTFHVVMYENRVAHFGNGARLLEYVIGSEEWKARYDVSKYSAFPLYGDIHAGKLFLQDHASHVWYRNLKIRPLSEDPWASKDFVWPDQITAIAPRAAAYGNGGSAGLRVVHEGGFIRLLFAQAAPWEMQVQDARGHRLPALEKSGYGDASLDASGLGAGAYLFSGLVDGRPFARPLLLSAPR